MTTRPADDSSRDRFRPLRQIRFGGTRPPSIAVQTRARAVAWALAYASRGWPVFPCQPGTKEPATRHGFHDASTDPDQISVLVAIASRRQSGHRHRRARTGRPGRRPPRPRRERLRRRSSGSSAPACSTAPGRSSGRRTADCMSTSPAAARPPAGCRAITWTSSPPAAMSSRRRPVSTASLTGRCARRMRPAGGLSWAAVTRLLEPQPARLGLPVDRHGTATCRRLAAWVERLEEGNRNAGLFWAACRAVESGQTAWLDDIAEAAAKTGLTEREIARTIELGQARQCAALRPPAGVARRRR